MSGPFVPNLTITFNLPVEGQFSTDPETGNPEQVTIPYMVKAWVQGSTSVEHQPGSNPNLVSFKGYLVSPKVIPPNFVLNQSEAAAVYIDPLTGAERKGKFTLEPFLNSTRPRVSKALARAIGTEIRGTFEFR